MAWFMAAAPYIAAAGTAVSVYGTIAQGNVNEQLANMQAKQMREQALSDQAESQVIAQQERKKADYLQSRVKSLAAASGTGMDSPNIVNTMADIDEQGAYNALSALFSGQTSARSKNLAARMTVAEGKAGKRSANMKAGSTILTSAASWYG